MRRIVAYGLTSVAFVVWPATVGALTSAVTNSLNYRDVFACGPNSLFMLLVLYGHSEVTLEQLKDVPVLSDGTSLLALRDAARRYGANLQVRHYSPEGIDGVHVPAIGQFYRSRTGIARLHFDLIYKVGADRVYLLNGTTGEPYWIRRSKLPQYWTGYVLAEEQPVHVLVMEKWGHVLLAACLLVADFCTLAALNYWLGCGETKKSLVQSEVVA